MGATPILFIDHAPALGGAEHSLLMILERLDRARWQAHLACCGGPLAERAAAMGIPVHVVAMPRLRRSPSVPLDLWRGIGSLAHVARQTRTRLLIANTVRSAFYTAPAALMTRVPFLWYRRDFWLGESQPRATWVDSMVKRLICATAVRVIANSHATAQHHPCPHKISVVHNGIDTARYSPHMDGLPFRREHGIPPSAAVIGTVGRLSPLKRQDRFVRALAHVRRHQPETWGIVAGGALFGQDDYAPMLHQLADELGQSVHVVFTGQMNDPRPALAAMDVFVQTGDPEAFGLVNVEAMASAKPVVAIAHGGLLEIVVDGETGLLVPPGDEDALATAILSLLEDPARRMSMGQAGRERVLRSFSIERTVQGVQTVLDELIEPCQL